VLHGPFIGGPEGGTGGMMRAVPAVMVHAVPAAMVHAVPAGMVRDVPAVPAAMDGKWLKGPGIELFQALEEVGCGFCFPFATSFSPLFITPFV
jgi:hypothetical protein